MFNLYLIKDYEYINVTICIKKWCNNVIISNSNSGSRKTEKQEKWNYFIKCIDSLNI